ncbi:UPF0058 family protein [Halobaculum gomorrense]|uniref:Metal-binding protein n=1 Tax=Halobaculum gomorrense TaxID=43928 RepID=A0A1M5V562_9EURY|nr:UPF0058 family protein [Halobaculum gomorrense]SHH70244.1 hypothetical protein SAMN05443636_3242 [Halobaculum gomorrense]
MKKQELIHLHGLLSEVRSEYEEWGTELDLTEYKDLGVKPTSIHRSKTDHKAAVFKLASGITSSAEETTEAEPVAPRAD